MANGAACCLRAAPLRAAGVGPALGAVWHQRQQRGSLAAPGLRPLGGAAAGGGAARGGAQALAAAAAGAAAALGAAAQRRSPAAAWRAGGPRAASAPLAGPLRFGRLTRRPPGRGTARRGASAAGAPSDADRGGGGGDRPTLLADPMPETLAARLAALGCAVTARGPEESLGDALTRVRPEVVLIRSTQFPRTDVESSGADRLRFVMRFGAGTDNLAIDALRARGVEVANAAGANAVAVAELTMAHLLNADRRLADQVVSLREGEWRRQEFAAGARGLYGSTLAVLGVGHIGREVVKRALAFGMHVRCWSRSLTLAEAQALGAEHCTSPEEAADGAHAVSVHVPLDGSTRGLVDEGLLRRLQPGAIVVNMSRGEVVDEAALVRLAEERGLRAGLDVFAQEPPAQGRAFDDDAIRRCAAIYGTHHTGARTQQAAGSVEDAAVSAVRAYLQGELVPGAVA